MKLYNGLAIPHINYCNAIWGGTYATHLLPIINMQKRIIRTINYAKLTDHTSSLFKSQNSLKFHDIHRVELLKIMHQIDHNHAPSELYKFKTKNNTNHNYNTRHNDDYLPPKFTKNHTQKSSVIYQATQEWNKINPEIKQINNIKLFKEKVKLEIVDSY